MHDMHPILLDFEARSRADLRKCGGRLYWAHPSSEALCCSWYDTRDGARGTWIPGDEWPHQGRLLAAHNMTGFDRHAAVCLGWLPSPCLEWLDTSELARRAGLPGALDELGQRWLGAAKDAEGSKFTKRLSSVRRPKHIPAKVWATYIPEQKRERGAQPQVDLATLERVVAYCESDVEIMVSAWPRLSEWRGIDEAVCRVDRVINDRGVQFDPDLALALLRCDGELAETALAQAGRELGWDVARVRAAARSNQQFTEATGAENARAATVRELEHPLAKARAALATIVRGKLEAGLTLLGEDNRIRDSHLYYGAHTGRWSGRGMQLQNLPRPSKRLEELDDDAVCALADHALAGGALAADEVSLLVRATLIAPPGKRLVVSDFKSVEAMALAWAAGDHEALAVFTSGADPYKRMAGVIFGCGIGEVTKTQRTVGKVASLACQYGMGGGKFEATARAMAGVELSEIGVDPFAVVAAWRRLHARIVAFWYAAERAFKAACEGRATWAGCFEFAPAREHDAIAAFLPSGRPVVYNHPRVSDDGASFDGARGRTHIYGGKIVENLIQAFCRDLLADALVRAAAAGLCPVMHVHDEPVCEVDKDAAKDGAAALHEIMTTAPDWAGDFPVGAKTEIMTRYHK